jgi:hypothetical protein
VLLAAAGAACSTDDENPAAARTPRADLQTAADETAPSPALGSRRITKHEHDRILRDVLHDDVGANDARIEDTTTGYDNDIRAQPQASAAYIEATETSAIDAAARFVSNGAAWSGVMPCTPTGAGDTACLKQFIGVVGRRLLRRTLAPEEIDRYVAAVAPFATERNDFKVGVQLALEALLQDVEFLYVVQTTRPIAGRPSDLALTGLSRASALSFLLWGTTPDDALLDKAEKGELDDTSRVVETATAMLDDPRSRPQLARFFAMWLGYERNPAMTAELGEEINHLIERNVFAPGGDVLDLFTSKDTYLPNDALADQYGLPHPPAGGGWVPYGASGRAGILSTGSVLTMGAKGDDTSPTQRGKAILEKLLCSPLKRPTDVNVDEPPAAPDSSPCKVARYQAIAASSPSCAGCHQKLDGLGLGLEGYDLHGRARAHDDANASCAIPGVGELPGVGTFKGPGELGPLLVKSGQLGACVVRQVFRYGLARAEQPSDLTSVDALTKDFEGKGRNLRKLLVALVSSSAFLTVQTGQE